jgi:hypothetical protein
MKQETIMNYRTFALTLVASLTLASGAGAMVYKHHPTAEDRQMTARSDMRYRQSDTQYWQNVRNEDRTGTLDALNPDPLTSANGQ